MIRCILIITTSSGQHLVRFRQSGKIHFKMCSKGGRAILRWSDYGINKIKQLSAELMKRSKATYDSVGSLAPNNVTYENTLKVNTVVVYGDVSV